MGKGERGWGIIHTLLRLSKRRVYSSRISCSRGVKRGGEDLDGLVRLLVDIAGVFGLSLGFKGLERKERQ